MPQELVIAGISPSPSSSSRRKEEGAAIEKGKSHPKGAKDGYSSGLTNL